MLGATEIYQVRRGLLKVLRRYGGNEVSRLLMSHYKCESEARRIGMRVAGLRVGQHSKENSGDSRRVT